MDVRAPVGASLTITLPLPPSTNKLYQKRRGGGQALSEEAKTYREMVKKRVVEELGCLMAIGHKTLEDPEILYRFDIALFFDSLENPGWFEFWKKDTYVTRGKWKGDLKGLKGERKAKTRYKVLDYDNRVKFLQDSLAKSLGIPNDCQVFGGHHGKYEDPENPRAEVTVVVEPHSKYFPRRS